MILMRWLSIGVMAALSACARPPASPTQSPDAPERFGKIEGHPDSRHWLLPDTSRAREHGASDAEVIAVEAAATGDRITGMITVPLRSCVLLIARAAASVEDVDLFAYGDDGTVLGVDEAQDKTPTLLVCPPHPRHIYVAARVAAGHGLVAVGAQHVEAKDAERVGKAVGARHRPGEADSRLTSWPGLEQKLAEHRRNIGASWQDVRRVALPLDPRVPTRLSAVVEENRCLDALVLPSEEVSHLDMTVMDASGRTVGRAAATGRSRSLVICSPVSAPISIEIRPHAGRGLAVVVLSRSAEGGSLELDVDAVRFDVAPTADLSETRAKNAVRLESAGYRAPELVGEGALQVGRRTSLSVDLPAGCARIDVLSGTPVQGVQAWLWAADGSLISQDRGAGQLVLFACSRGGRGRLDTEALMRPGKYAVEMRDERETPKVLLAHPLAAGRLLSRMLARGVIRSAAQVGAPRVVSLEPTRLEAMDVLVPFGRCVDLTLALGAGAMGAELRLLDKEKDQELELVRGVFSASARACGLDRSNSLFVRAEMRVTTGATDALVVTRMLSPKP